MLPCSEQAERDELGGEGQESSAQVIEADAGTLVFCGSKKRARVHEEATLGI